MQVIARFMVDCPRFFMWGLPSGMEKSYLGSFTKPPESREALACAPEKRGFVR